MANSDVVISPHGELLASLPEPLQLRHQLLEVTSGHRTFSPEPRPDPSFWMLVPCGTSAAPMRVSAFT